MRTQIKNIVTHLIDDGGDTIKNGLSGFCWGAYSFVGSKAASFSTSDFERSSQMNEVQFRNA